MPDASTFSKRISASAIVNSIVSRRISGPKSHSIGEALQFSLSRFGIPRASGIITNTTTTTTLPSGGILD